MFQQNLKKSGILSNNFKKTKQSERATRRGFANLSLKGYALCRRPPWEEQEGHAGVQNQMTESILGMIGVALGKR